MLGFVETSAYPTFSNDVLCVKNYIWWLKNTIIVITFYSLSCLDRETAKGPCGLGVKLPPAHLFTTHGGGFTLSLCITERQAGKLLIPIFIVFGLTRPRIEPESTVSVTNPLPT